MLSKFKHSDLLYKHLGACFLLLLLQMPRNIRDSRFSILQFRDPIHFVNSIKYIYIYTHVFD